MDGWGGQGTAREERAEAAAEAVQAGSADGGRQSSRRHPAKQAQQQRRRQPTHLPGCRSPGVRAAAVCTFLVPRQTLGALQAGRGQVGPAAGGPWGASAVQRQAATGGQYPTHTTLTPLQAPPLAQRAAAIGRPSPVKHCSASTSSTRFRHMPCRPRCAPKLEAAPGWLEPKSTHTFTVSRALQGADAPSLCRRGGCRR